MISTLHRMQDLGMCSDVQQHNESLYSLEPKHSWHMFGLSLCHFEKGQWWLGANGLTCPSGKRGVHICATFTGHGLKKKPLPPLIISAREITKAVTKKECYGSIASCARALLRWTGLDLRYRREAEDLFRNGRWHYYKCLPGQYKKANYFDVKSCYYSIISRLPSPYMWIDFNECRIVFDPLPVEGARRWKKLIASVKGHKLLRNTLSGCMGGSAWKGKPGKAIFFCNGKEYFKRMGLGPLPCAQMLTVRTEWELCSVAVEQSNALYAITDSVITLDDKPPPIWIDAGFTVNKEHSGDADIQAIAKYKIGDKETEEYKESMKWFSQRPGRRIFMDEKNDEPQIDIAWHPWILREAEKRGPIIL
jgi:hypothetical protein